MYFKDTESDNGLLLLEYALHDWYWRGIVCAVAYAAWMMEFERLQKIPDKENSLPWYDAKQQAAAWLELLKGE